MSETTATTAPKQFTLKTKSKFREYTETIIWALLLAFAIRTWVIEPFKIPSGSMENTLAIGDHLFVNRFLYGIKIPFTDTRILRIRAPHRGDVVVFEYPEDPSKDFIKRVIGVPGDVIQEKDKVVYVNGVPYRNPHEIHRDSTILPAEAGPRDNFGPVTVPANSYFMMGDNRDNSYDSRFWGFVKDSALKGKAFIKYWSWDQDNWRVRWGSIGQPID
ncbi:signal peptidase I [Geotalea uraniireducens]|uniref:Signal peptidase I n=1 Tax=Geotalea uraniireducens TaxID=351604 RepID=A0ABM8EPK4_9BACT|nr:signal peptidase I [Geotalea uraniireducens]BDV43973.1 signal peptidase I [Geotalea uraniireducens]